MARNARCVRRNSGNAGGFRRRRSRDERWTYYDDPLLEDLLALHEILWRKYQRKHLSWEDFEAVGELIRDRGGEAPVY